RLAELAHQLPAVTGALDLLTRRSEHPLDLLIQLVAISDDHHARLGVVLQNPLGQQHHHNAFTAALRVPDDAALLLPDTLLRSLDAEVLMHTRQLLVATIK